MFMKWKCILVNLKSAAIAVMCLFAFTHCLAQGSCASPDGSFNGTSLISGSPISYATANSNGFCYNDLTAGTTYCWNYLYPSSGSIVIQLIFSGACSPCSNGSSWISTTACSGGCSSSGKACVVQYNSSCSIQQSGGIEFGTGCSPAQTCNTIFTICVSIPAGCTTMDVCPLSYCASGGSNCAVVPIELLSFVGRSECDKNVITWKSATETNNDFYTIERSVGGNDYSVVGTVKGGGNSTTTLQYSFADILSDQEYRVEYLYYRLKQTDFDGESEVFHPIVIKKNCGDEIFISPSITNGTIYVTAGKSKHEALISIVDELGRDLYSENTPEDWTERIIDLSAYENGIYFVRINIKSETIVKKIVLNR